MALDSSNENEQKNVNQLSDDEDDVEYEDDDDDEQDTSFKFRLDSTQTFVKLLKCLQLGGFKKGDMQPLIIAINSGGVKFITEKHKCMQASCILDVDFFDEFKVEPENRQAMYCVDLASLLECLTVYNSPQTVLLCVKNADQASLELVLVNTDRPDNGPETVTHCLIKTFEFESPTKFSDLDKGGRFMCHFKV